MFQLILTITKRYWIVVLVLLLGMLSTYTSLPMYGAQASTPTPDVQTVPKPEIPPTPTNTPFPTPTPNSSSGDSTPVATPRPAEDDDNDDEENNDVENGNNDTGNNSGGNSGGNNGSNNGGSTNTNPGSGTTSTQPVATQPAKTGLTGVVAAVTLNMRKGPSTTDNIIDTLFMNDLVEIIGRDSTGSWWYICCGARAQLSGWVSAQLITPNFAAAQANTLIPIISNTAHEPASAAQNAARGSTAQVPVLLLEMRPLPAFAWQGQTMDLHFVVHNKSANAVTNVQLRNDLPPDLVFVEATIGSQGSITSTNTRPTDSIFTIEWPELAANEQFTATVTIQIQPATASGVLIDNLAIVTTDEGDEALAGITIAMPPVVLPQFR